MEEFLYSVLFAFGSVLLYRIAKKSPSSSEDPFFNRFGSYLMSVMLGLGSLLCLARAFATLLRD